MTAIHIWADSQNNYLSVQVLMCTRNICFLKVETTQVLYFPTRGHSGAVEKLTVSPRPLSLPLRVVVKYSLEKPILICYVLLQVFIHVKFSENVR